MLSERMWLSLPDRWQRVRHCIAFHSAESACCKFGNQSSSHLRIELGSVQPQWHFVISAAIHQPAGTALLNASPLLEEKRYIPFSTLVPNGNYPVSFQRSRAEATFPSDDDPTYA